MRECKSRPDPRAKGPACVVVHGRHKRASLPWRKNRVFSARVNSFFVFLQKKV